MLNSVALFRSLGTSVLLIAQRFSHTVQDAEAETEQTHTVGETGYIRKEDSWGWEHAFEDNDGFFVAFVRVSFSSSSLHPFLLVRPNP